MLRTIAFHGVIAGLVVGIPTFGLPVVLQGMPPMTYGMIIGYATMLIALSAVFLAIKHYRDREGGGVIRFWPAFGIGLGVTFVASLFYVAAWEAAMAVTHLDFAAMYGHALIEKKRATGASAEEIARLAAEMQQFAIDYANPLFRLPMTFAEIFPVGVIVSLLSAALLRNSRFLAVRRA